MASNTPAGGSREKIFQYLGFLLVLLAGLYFRYTGLMWGGYEYQHPDERFLVWVVADIAPVDSVGAYFDTQNSSLNPANRGHQFYVYGDLPVILVRYFTEWSSTVVGWEEILQVGRGASAAFDLLTVLLVYLTAKRISGWKIATLAGLFSAAAVLEIQQSHFFTVDSFATTFTTLAIYLAVLLVTEPDGISKPVILRYSLLFGGTVGLAMACKLNTVPIAALLVIALGIRWLRSGESSRLTTFVPLALIAVASGLTAFFVFRLAQPYAFSGPGFFNLKPDEIWLKSIRDLSAQSAGDVDFPPALQWARRMPWFSLQNLVVWGLGIPLGGLAWAGFFIFLVTAVGRLRSQGIKILSDLPWTGIALIWVWTAFYFTWQSTAWNPTMRYQLPIYPTLVVLAAWGLGEAWNAKTKMPVKNWRIVIGTAGALVLMLTFAWAFAFTRIYTRTETRLAASLWLFENAPGPVNIDIQTENGPLRQLLPVPEQVVIQPELPYFTWFRSDGNEVVDAVILSKLQVSSSGAQAGLTLRARIVDPNQPDFVLGEGEIFVPRGNQESLELPFNEVAAIEPGKLYSLMFSISGDSIAQEDTETSFAIVQINGQVQLRSYLNRQTVEIQKPSFEMSSVSLEEDGTLTKIRLPEGTFPEMLTILLNDPLTGNQQISNAVLGAPGIYRLSNPIHLEGETGYSLGIASATPGASISFGTPMELIFLDGPVYHLLPGVTPLARAQDPLWQQFSAIASGEIKAVTLGYATQVDPSVEMVNLILRIENSSQPGKSIGVTRFQVVSTPGDPRGTSYKAVFPETVELVEGQVYSFSLTAEGPGAVAVRGSALANETSWDMGLPFRTAGYDPFGGIYRSDLNFEMYWDDNSDKYQRFTGILDQTDYILISSNRQWGTTTRLPERHPLTTAYYRALLGCPEEKDIIWCYNVAEVGSFQGQLGFDLVKTFTSYPDFGPVEINTQFAEEAFTVYDHPKVFIFKKRPDYDSSAMRTILSTVDLSKVVRITPKHAAEFKDMLFPPFIWKIQQAGGTWSELFPPQGLLNRLPWLGLVVWYIFIFLLGVVVYPLVRLAFPGLADLGYPLARITGMLLFAYLAWLSGSLRIPVSRSSLGGILAVLSAVGVILAILQGRDLLDELRTKKVYFLRVELIALVLFSISVLIRLGNPDLWHPIFGGEKPMDFSQFNAVLKSTVFPPYDPWFAGGTLNYYYFGYVLVGMPVKFIGITPSVAYNYLLPSLFSITGLAAYSIAWNLASSTRAKGFSPNSFGLAAVLGLLILGNLGTVRMVWQGFQRLAVPEDVMKEGTFINHWAWAAQGAGKLISGEADHLPYYTGDWYWKPSRAIQPEAGNEITEFPYFTFIYADLHAHLIALPLTLLAIAWAISAVLTRGRWGGPDRRYAWLSLTVAVIIGAVVLGALRPANTWDQYTYLVLAAIALFYGQCQDTTKPCRWWRSILPVLSLVVLAVVFYRPFDRWFGQGYNELVLWEGARTGLSSYLVHWGLFLYVITAWIFLEVVDWMAATPLSELSRLRPFGEVIIAGIVFIILVIAYLLFRGVVVALVIAPLGIFTALLLLRPGQPPAKRAVLFMTGTALALTLAVELVAVKGDINRMNTVFKFYYQSWSLMSLSAAAALGWILDKPGGLTNRRLIWLLGLCMLVFGAFLYPLTATKAKLEDRMTPAAPHTLDGMSYMAYSTYGDGPTPETYQEMQLAQDYYAIRWVQQNIEGSPVVVEANTPEYRHWGSRFTIYTGLPGVVGWNWHERQQRALTPDTWVYDRIDAIRSFYMTTNHQKAEEFIRKYNVGIIILGQLERIYYQGAGLEKFSQLDGVLWDKVYEDQETVIYRVR